VRLKGFETKGITGRPMGSAAFLAEMEARTGRSLAPRKRGPKAIARQEFR
jgi:hypothetical protein